MRLVTSVQAQKWPLISFSTATPKFLPVKVALLLRVCAGSALSLGFKAGVLFCVCGVIGPPPRRSPVKAKLRTKFYGASKLIFSLTEAWSNK